jgi:hypothetical protein
MTDLSAAPPPDAATAERSTPVYRPRPRWFKVFIIVGVAVVLLMGALLLAGGGPGGHGPGRHRSAPAGQSPAPAVEGHQPPPGGHR